MFPFYFWKYFSSLLWQRYIFSLGNQNSSTHHRHSPSKVQKYGIVKSHNRLAYCYDVTSLWRQDGILCKQIPTNDYSLKWTYSSHQCQGIFPKYYGPPISMTKLTLNEPAININVFGTAIQCWTWPQLMQPQTDQFISFGDKLKYETDTLWVFLRKRN